VSDLSVVTGDDMEQRRPEPTTGFESTDPAVAATPLTLEEISEVEQQIISQMDLPDMPAPFSNTRDPHLQFVQVEPRGALRIRLRFPGEELVFEPGQRWSFQRILDRFQPRIDADYPGIVIVSATQDSYSDGDSFWLLDGIIPMDTPTWAREVARHDLRGVTTQEYRHRASLMSEARREFIRTRGEMLRDKLERPPSAVREFLQKFDLGKSVLLESRVEDGVVIFSKSTEKEDW
jgi:hypothetical protein